MGCQGIIVENPHPHSTNLKCGLKIMNRSSYVQQSAMRLPFCSCPLSVYCMKVPSFKFSLSRPESNKDASHRLSASFTSCFQRTELAIYQCALPCPWALTTALRKHLTHRKEVNNIQIDHATSRDPSEFASASTGRRDQSRDTHPTCGPYGPFPKSRGLGLSYFRRWGTSSSA